MRNIQPSVLSTKDERLKCMHKDAKLLFNLLDQRQRGYFLDTDYLWPGQLSGQSKLSVLNEICKSIQNHIEDFNNNNEILM